MRKETEKMKSILYNFRLIFTIILFVNIILLIERSIFDFLGFMFGMIIGDILHLIFLIVGLFGAFQYRVNYVVTCIIWSLLWLAWNTFIICNYLSLGILNKYDPIVLNLNTGRKSWWLINSIGCTGSIFTNETIWSTPQTFDIPNKYQSINSIESFILRNCIVPFHWIEIIHSSALIFFSTLTVIFGLLLANAFNDEDDTFDYIGGFDAPAIINTFTTDQFIPTNAHIRLEPLYAENHNNNNNNQNGNIFEAQTLRIK